MKKLRFLISLPTSKNDFQLAQALSAEQTAQKRAIDLDIVYADNDAVQQPAVAREVILASLRIGKCVEAQEPLPQHVVAGNSGQERGTGPTREKPTL